MQSCVISVGQRTEHRGTLWPKGLNTEEMHKEMLEDSVEECVSRKTMYNWIQKFNNG